MTKTSVDGLGEGAFFATGAGRKLLTTLTVKKATSAFVFHIYGVDKLPDQISIEKKQAQGVVAKL